MATVTEKGNFFNLDSRGSAYQALRIVKQPDDISSSENPITLVVDALESILHPNGQIKQYAYIEITETGNPDNLNGESVTIKLVNNTFNTNDDVILTYFFSTTPQQGEIPLFANTIATLVEDTTAFLLEQSEFENYDIYSFGTKIYIKAKEYGQRFALRISDTDITNNKIVTDYGPETDPICVLESYLPFTVWIKLFINENPYPIVVSGGLVGENIGQLSKSFVPTNEYIFDLEKVLDKIGRAHV